MKPSASAALASCALLLSAFSAASQEPAEIVPCGVPLAALPPCTDPPAASAATVAVVDGASLSTKDLDEKLRERVLHLDEAIVEARRNALSAEVDMVLIECEAARRNVAPRDLYETEVVQKITAPSEADVKAEFEKRHDRIGAEPLEKVKTWLSGLILEEREAARVAEFAKSLRSRFPVVLQDPSGTGLRADGILATVGTRSITIASASTRLDAAAYAVARAVWQDESKAVKELVRARLLKSEAAKRETTPDAILRTEVEERVAAPTDAETAAEHQKFRSTYGDDLAAVKGRIVESLRRSRQAALERDLDKKLSEGRSVRVTLEEPRRPVLTIDTGRSPSRGNPNAAVTFVEMGDFQCPPCGRVWGLVEEALKPYGDRVRYVFRQKPLVIHEFAAKAAEASLAAHEQGKFWEYADILFHQQNALDVASLKRHAVEAGLDAERFARDLDSGRFGAVVREETRAAARCGVVGTPAFFVNGVPLVPPEFTVDGFRAAVDKALREAAGARTSASPAP